MVSNTLCFYYVESVLLIDPLNILLLLFWRFETYDTNAHPPSRLGKRVRIAATSILNVNVSAANLEAFVETVVSWRRQRELEQKATKLNEVKCAFKIFNISQAINYYLL